MEKHSTVHHLLESIRKFNRAMDGPSSDAEIDAACKMRDAALLVVAELDTPETQVLLEEYEQQFAMTA